VPASPLESPGHTFTAEDLTALLSHPQVLGLAEMMNFPGVVSGDPRELSKLGLAHGGHVDGHAPGLLGTDLNAYAAAGIDSDHEAVSYEEGLQRLRAGMWLLIREASPARNLEALAPLLREFGPSRIAFCSDDRDPEDTAENGHINGMVRKAVALGVAVEDALVAATASAARCHRLHHLGALAPGYQADVVLLPDLERFDPVLVLKRGRPVGAIPRSDVPAWTRESMRIGVLDADAFAAPSDGGPIRVIGLIPDQIVTQSLVERPTLEAGLAVADPDRDLAKVAVVERHHASGRTAVGFVRGAGLARGALASSMAHDAHNIVAIGMDDDDLRGAVERVAEIGGGLVVIEAGEITAECPLPVAGLLSVAPLAEVIDQSRRCDQEAVRLGWSGASPFLTLSFLALSVIPSLKITDQGLVDVERGRIVSLQAG
jgi:adenine deaminase